MIRLVPGTNLKNLSGLAKLHLYSQNMSNSIYIFSQKFTQPPVCLACNDMFLDMDNFPRVDNYVTALALSLSWFSLFTLIIAMHAHLCNTD